MARAQERLPLLYSEVSIFGCPLLRLVKRSELLYCLNLLTIRRDNGVLAIENLMKKKGKFDYILLETTGLADPGPIASIFWMDDDLGSDIYLDGIVTLVDSRNVRKVLLTPFCMVTGCQIWTDQDLTPQTHLSQLI